MSIPLCVDKNVSSIKFKPFPFSCDISLQTVKNFLALAKSGYYDGTVVSVGFLGLTSFNNLGRKSDKGMDQSPLTA